jgi:uncharacterized protein DUF6260
MSQKGRAGRASASTPKQFFSASGGRWATERILRGMQAGHGMTPASLRTLDTLSKDEWVQFDEVAVREGVIRLRGVAALISRGLTIPVPNALGKTMLQWEGITDMNDAEVTMSGLHRTEDDAIESELFQMPLPITHKDFNINLRTLNASRERGEALDTLQAGMAGRLVGEMIEYMLFNGLTKKFGGSSVYGLTTHPDRNTIAIGTTWVTETGDNIVLKVLAMVQALIDDRFFGPYILFVPSNFGLGLERDLKANGDLTIRQRLLQIDQLADVVVCDQLAASNVVLAQATRDVMAIAQGEPIQTIQWDLYGGMQLAFKVFAIQLPVVRSTKGDRSGIVHAS